MGLSATVVNNIIYAVGGTTESGWNSHTFLSTVEAYNPASNTWTTMTPMPTPRSFLGVGVINSHLYAAGGTVSNTGLPTMESFTPTPVKVAVEIEIRPESINPRSRGKIMVVLLSTDTFDATRVDTSTVRFGATGTEAFPSRYALKDVNRDGRMDLVLHFDTEDTGIQCGDTSASLTATTFSGQTIEGTAAIRTVGCGQKHHSIKRVHQDR